MNCSARYGDALKAFDKSLEIDPNNTDALEDKSTTVIR
jgi:cytochrome c-type biogenesis protein CcmH/NrfG